MLMHAACFLRQCMHVSSIVLMYIPVQCTQHALYIIPVFIIIAHSDDQQLRSRFKMLTIPAKEALVVSFSMFNTPKGTRSTLAQLMTQFQAGTSCASCKICFRIIL